MNIIKTMAIGTILLTAVSGLALAEDNAIKGLKLGFGFDQGFGVTGSIGKFNGFIGNDGLAIDFIFARDKVNKTDPLYWYVGGGGYGEWGDAVGARIPFGLEYSFAQQKEPIFAKHWDAYLQLAPKLRITKDTKFGMDFGIGLRYKF